MKTCLICNRITAIQQNKNPNFVCELETSYVVLGDSQFYRGYSLLLYKEHYCELHELPKTKRFTYLKEMSIVAAAVQEVFQPVKLNYELLGNRHPHLHWHITPRHADDPNIHNPIWIIDKQIRNFTLLKTTELLEMKQQLKTAIGERWSGDPLPPSSFKKDL